MCELDFKVEYTLFYYCVQGWQFLPRGGFFHGFYRFFPSRKKPFLPLILEETGRNHQLRPKSCIFQNKKNLLAVSINPINPLINNLTL